MKILVTGGAGFIASHIADAYLAAGHEVVVLDDLSSGKRANVPAAAKFYPADIRSPETREIVRNERPEVISHHAAQMDVRRSVADPGFDAEVNVLGFINLLEAAREVGVRKVIFASSGGAVYGEQVEFPASESHAHDPLSPYGITKATGEHYLYYYRAVHGLPYVALRYANVFGPRQDPHGEAGVVAIFTERLLAGQAPTINGDGGQTRDYVFVADVVRANVAALETSRRLDALDLPTRRPSGDQGRLQGGVRLEHPGVLSGGRRTHHRRLSTGSRSPGLHHRPALRPPGRQSAAGPRKRGLHRRSYELRHPGSHGHRPARQRDHPRVHGHGAERRDPRFRVPIPGPGWRRHHQGTGSGALALRLAASAGCPFRMLAAHVGGAACAVRSTSSGCDFKANRRCVTLSAGWVRW